ncbi:MAG TPA: hypothetical protein VFD50_10120 [Thermoleophilia bacterium]|nr:hypothetical protein [Thermoleophilia bacterium]
MLPPPALVIDECLSTRLATDLARRGRPAKSIASLGLRGLDDPQVFDALRNLGEPYVIITADTAMPLDWMDAIEAAGATVAVIDSRHAADYLVAEWYCDVTHRWAHVMQNQPAGSVHRYTARGHRKWRPRHKPRR